jgi:hypothetical protein
LLDGSLLFKNLTLPPYNQPGTHLGFVDALSRNPIPGSSLNVHIISPVDWISAAQSQDKSITSIIKIIMTGERFAHKDLFNKYGVKGGRLYYNSSEGQKLVLPKHCRWQILRVYHDDGGHFALDKTLHALKSHFWFPKMRRFVIVRRCQASGAVEEPEEFTVTVYRLPNTVIERPLAI